MSYHQINKSFFLSDEQEQLLESIYITVKDKYGYSQNDVLDFIVHSKHYYELTNNNRKTYLDLFMTIVNDIAQYENNKSISDIPTQIKIHGEYNIKELLIEALNTIENTEKGE